MIYSTATMAPEPAVLGQIGLDLGEADFAAARRWTEANRGAIVLHPTLTIMAQALKTMGAALG